MVTWKERNSRAAYRVKELESLLGLSRSTINRLFDNRKLIRCKIGAATLVTREDVERLMAAAKATDPSVWQLPGSKSTVHMDFMDWFTTRSGHIVRVWRRGR